jgi:hypothetical protein
MTRFFNLEDLAVATSVQKKKKKQKSSFQLMGDNFVALGKLMQRPGAKLGDIANAADACGMKIDVRLTKPLEPFKPQTGTSQIKRTEELQAAEFMGKAKSLLAGVPEAFKYLIADAVQRELNQSSAAFKDTTGLVDHGDVYLLILENVRKERDALLKCIAEYDKAEKPAVASLEANCDNNAKDDTGGR